MKSCCFIADSIGYGYLKPIQNELKKIINTLLENGITVFRTGTDNDFADLVNEILEEVKITHPEIEIYNDTLLNTGDIVDGHFKFKFSGISERNKYLVDTCDASVFFINNEYPVKEPLFFDQDCWLTENLLLYKYALHKSKMVFFMTKYKNDD